MLVILDCNYICHQAKHVFKDFTYDEKSTGVLFGFMRRLLFFAEKFGSTRFVFCWDAPKETYYRRHLLPTYKIYDDDKTEEEKEYDRIAYDQFAILREYILPKLGFKNNFLVDGFEADDLIAGVLVWNPIMDDFPIVVTGDHDMHQLLAACKIYHPRAEKFYTRKDFREQWGLLPFYWANVKAIAGCSGDKVPGVPGVAELTASRYIKKELKEGGKIWQRIEDNQELIERNLELVKLPHRKLEAKHVMLQDGDQFDLDAFVDICDEFGFAFFLRLGEYRKWKAVFSP